jgi:hypothetical protein
MSSQRDISNLLSSQEKCIRSIINTTTQPTQRSINIRLLRRLELLATVPDILQRGHHGFEDVVELIVGAIVAGQVRVELCLLGVLVGKSLDDGCTLASEIGWRESGYGFDECGDANDVVGPVLSVSCYFIDLVACLIGLEWTMLVPRVRAKRTAVGSEYCILKIDV